MRGIVHSMAWGFVGTTRCVGACRGTCGFVGVVAVVSEDVVALVEIPATPVLRPMTENGANREREAAGVSAEDASSAELFTWAFSATQSWLASPCNTAALPPPA